MVRLKVLQYFAGLFIIWNTFIRITGAQKCKPKLKTNT